MKRILVLLLSLVLLVTVIAATVSADPVHVGRFMSEGIAVSLDTQVRFMSVVA
jgi:hypothetical protein